MNPRPVFITPGRHPFEIALLGACVIAGAVMAITGVRPPSLSRSLPYDVMTVWLALVAAGGLVGIVGAYWRGRIDDGLLIEFGGVLAIGSACTLYVIALFALNPLANAVASGGLLSGIAVGGVLRAVQCARDWARVRRAHPRRVEIELPLLIEDAPEPDEPGERP